MKKLNEHETKSLIIHYQNELNEINRKIHKTEKTVEELKVDLLVKKIKS